ncbi:MAG: PAS domain S-box protein [Deltaproteobacteria bacterium]|nr:PAS domain S-box protein [Deltaproteobacteria bacterium]
MARWPVLDNPHRAFLVVLGAIFAAEFLTMWWLRDISLSMEGMTDAFLDSFLLLAVTAPVLYLLFVRPMARGIAARARTERALRAAREGLERRVAERTSALEAANRSLRHEMEERTRADRRIHFQASLLDAVEQAVVATDVAGNILYWNRFAETLYGWKAADAQGQPLATLTPFDVEGACVDDVHSRCSVDRGWTGEVSVVRRDGSRFPAHLTCSPVRSADSELAGFVYAFLDIRERKEAEEALRYSEEKYSTLVENSPTGIFIYRDGKIVFANQRYLEMVGRSRDEIGSITPESTIHSDDWPRVQEIGRRRLAGESVPSEYECRIVSPAGQERWVSVRNTLVAFRRGVSVLGNIQDITERKSAEKAVRDSREALRRLSARLLTVQEDERRRVARELHDSIGQSLSAIKFVVERALEGAWPDKPTQPFLALQTLVPTIQSSVEEVRRISMALRPSTLDDLGLVATIAWFTREFQTALPDMRVERDVTVPEAAIPEALKTVIFRILQEALHNVGKHSRAGRVEVSLRREGGALVLCVKDDGAGFDAGSAKREDLGTGFGLSFMQERAELSGGILTVASAPGTGTEVTARWPLEGVRAAES